MYGSKGGKSSIKTPVKSNLAGKVKLSGSKRKM